jgi:hypothetical protein
MVYNLHVCTVHQQYRTLHYPTDALSYINRSFVKTSERLKYFKRTAPTFFGSRRIHHQGAISSKSSPVTGLEWPRGFQEVKVPRFHDNGTGWWEGCQPYAPAAFTPRNVPGIHFC